MRGAVGQRENYRNVAARFGLSSLGCVALAAGLIAATFVLSYLLAIVAIALTD